MEILINRFTLRHNGAEYEPGDVIEIDDVQGRDLIKRSGGYIVEVSRKNTRVKKVPKEVPTGLPEKEDGEMELSEDIKGTSESEPPTDTAEDHTEEIALPTADPTKAVSTARRGKKK